MSMLVSFVLSFFPRDVLDEILNLIGSVSEGFPSYFSIIPIQMHSQFYSKSMSSRFECCIAALEKTAKYEPVCSCLKVFLFEMVI